MKIAALIASLVMMGSFLNAQAASAQDAQDASAQDASADTNRDEEARMSFELGSRHYRRGEFRQAAEAFERSHAYSPHPELLYNAYLGYRDANDDANAARTLRGYLEGVEHTAERRVVLERRLAALEAELGGDAEPATDVDSGGESAPEEPSSGSPIGAIVLTSVGAAAVVAGVVTAIVTNGIHSDVAAECPNQTCANLAAQQADIDRGRRFGRTTDALLFGGGALLVGGVLWWVLGGSSGDESASQQTNVQATCVQSGCELGVRGSF